MYEDISSVSYGAFDGKSVLHRLVLGLGHRFYKASLHIESADPGFRPSAGAMSLQELLNHIGELVVRSRAKVVGRNCVANNRFSAAEVMAEINSLEAVVLAADFSVPKDEFFYIISGPIADAISHIGQMNTYMRMMGITGPNRNYYKGITD